MDNAAHYNDVAEAWKYLLGKNLHYGFFDNPSISSLDQATAALTELMINWTRGLTEESRVLDLGCGTGQPAIDLMRKYGCEIVGISPSLVCIETATSKIPDGYCKTLSFEVGDAHKLKYSDNSFDLVWAMESTHLMEDKKRVIEESFRVLKPGGRLLLCDIVLQRNLSLPEVIENKREFVVLKNVFGRALMKTAAFYVETAQNAGFSEISKRNISSATHKTFEFWHQNALTHEVEVLRLLGREKLNEFLNATDILSKMWENKLGYLIFTAKKLT